MIRYDIALMLAAILVIAAALVYNLIAEWRLKRTLRTAARPRVKR